MALVKCPECKKKISDQCDKCHNCGYPIKEFLENDNVENIGKIEIKNVQKPIYKQMWFWIIIGLVVISIIVGIVLFFNRETKPKFGPNGEPEFIEFTSEVYTNADDYLGYFINIKGKVFQVMGDNGSTKGIQIWIDPDSCEHNLMIYYDSDVEVKQGDYIICTGYIDSVTKYKNAYDAELEVPLVYSSDLRKASYIEVIAPTIEEWVFDNLKKEQLGYSIAIDKVEFSELETRIYATVVNNGKATLHVGDGVVVQNGKQYNSEVNYNSDYEKIPYEIVKGVSCSGIIVLPVINNEEFEISFDINSDDVDEALGQFTFKISRNIQKVENVDNTIREEIVDSSENSVGSEQQKNETNVNSLNRYTEAVLAAEMVANNFKPTDRYFVREVLINPSLQEEFDAFSEEEADYAIQNANIDWVAHALAIVSDQEHSTPSGVKDSINGLTDAEKEYVVNNCGIDWNEKACQYALNAAGKNYITWKDIFEYVKWAGFTDGQAAYGVDNATIDWENQIVYYKDYRMHKFIDYTYCESCGDIYGVHDICPFCQGEVEIYGTFGYTIEETRALLQSERFPEESIEAYLPDNPDATGYYNESNYRKP